MRKIIRWTIGYHNSIAYICLKNSIRTWSNLYDDEFELFICYNNLDKNRINFLKKINNVKLINQQDFSDSLNIRPFDTFWKFYPPRIDVNSYEIFTDNDILFHKKLYHLDEFLKSKKIIFTSSHKSMYGNFYCKTNKEIKVNTGFFGLFPNLDFQKQINTIINNKNNGYFYYGDHCDDQGVFCSILNKFDYIQIPLSFFNVCNSNVQFAPYKLGKNATHFAGINHANKPKYIKKFLLNKFI